VGTFHEIERGVARAPRPRERPVNGVSVANGAVFSGVVSSDPVSSGAGSGDDDLDRALKPGGVHSVYQPVVEIDSGAIVGYEALARGPRGSAFERPDLLFAAAQRWGRLTELDRACQTAAAQGARSGGLRAPWTLFVNVEPAAAATLLSSGAASSPVLGSVECQVVVELTERALVAAPSELLALVARIRSKGWGIALDDLGAHPDSLALLPLLQPDVIKLDLSLVQRRPSADIAAIVGAVNAEAESSGSVVLAEGIETEQHRDIALAMGASLGQGWLLGRPAALPDPLPEFAGTAVRVNGSGGTTSARSPFAVGATFRAPRPSRKDLLIEMSKHLETQALAAGSSTIVLSTFQNASFFTPATRRRYARLAQGVAFVGAMGTGMPAQPLAGVRGCELDPDDPVAGEWDIVVLGPHFAATLVARDLGDTGPDRDRRFDFVLSYDRKLAIQAALALFSRVWAQP
jgi:EAL domain-containing protein (putative c-di-GMP-specific phosphodiesterase class I)